MLTERISHFLQDPGAGGAGSFDALALAAFTARFEADASYRRRCEERGATPAAVAAAGGWRAVPPLPSETAPAAGPAAADLARCALDATFRVCGLPPGGAPVAVLSLVAGEDGTALLAEHVPARFGTPASAAAASPHGLDAARARSWAGARQREGRPVLVLATAAALRQWLGALARQELRFRLPAGTAVALAGGLDGAAREALHTSLSERLGVPPQAVARLWSAPGLASWIPTRALAGGDPDLFVPPHWCRARVLDPESPADAEVPAGTPGRLAVFDLASGALHVRTGARAVAGGAGFRLLEE
jgi:hypothetical protein